MRKLILLLPILFFFLAGCGVYSFTGASIPGKSINIHVLENKARNVVPTLSPALTTKVRNRILSQTGLSPLNNDNADYDITGTITAYEVTVTSMENNRNATQNRLTISVSVNFKNNIDEKGSFTQSFSRFADFPANQTLQSREGELIDKIGNDLADDIFNKAFVNW